MQSGKSPKGQLFTFLQFAGIVVIWIAAFIGKPGYVFEQAISKDNPVEVKTLAVTAAVTSTVYLAIVQDKSTAISPTPTPIKLADGEASWSAPLAHSPVRDEVWIVNPDAGSVTVVDTDKLQKQQEIPVGREPWSVVISPDGKHTYVIDQALGHLVVIDAERYITHTTLYIGPEARSIALSPSGKTAYITVMANNEIVVLDTERLQVEKRIPVPIAPYAIAVTDDGDNEDQDEMIYVTHFFARQQPNGVEATDNGRAGHVSVISADTDSVTAEIILLPNATGFPNLLAGIAIKDERAWIPQVRAAPDLPTSLTSTVFAAVSTLDLSANQEDALAHLPLNDQEIFGSPVNNPMAAVPSPDGRILYVVLAGSDLVEAIDISVSHQPRLRKFLPVGKNPRGMVLSADGRKGYVMNYLSRSLTVLDLEKLQVTTEITTTNETLAPTVIHGKILFNNAVNPKLSQGSWISCASCHPDGNTDSVTWMSPDGPRQSPPLWNAEQTLPWHWSATQDEPQDVEQSIQLIQHGLGLAPGADPEQLGEPNAGRSADLDALAAFITQGFRVPSVVANNEVEPGRVLFQSAGCVTCHGGPTWTTSVMSGTPGVLDLDGNGMVDSALHNVGTLNGRDVRGAAGFDPPSLLGVGLTPPYLHDGSMPSLEALLRSGHPDPHGGGNGLDETEITQLTQFLHSIGADTAPVTQP